ncbi:CRISPR-associated protein Cas4 [Haloferula sargassicola]|uniref:CRISPR-associated exonuclease Cas4 n=1 Tax=Haloferula sargassicola TaxID=490096 RepID=A0ABP9UNC8_9BACT
MISDDDLLPLSALQHFLYCPRQCALIHLEQAWAENRYTAEGNRMHARAHEGPDESRPGIRITRGMPVVSRELGLSGQCDVVEFHTDGRVLPVEYKRGKPKAHRADEVQVAAQAMALEEMLGVEIPRALLFYGKTHRRVEVALDAELRGLCRELAAALHAMMRERETPPADYEARKCDACSLIEICQPRALRFKRGVAAWFDAQLNSTRRPPEP